MATETKEGYESPVVEDLSVRNQPRRGGTYHRIVDTPPVISEGGLYTEEGECIQLLKGKEVKIVSEKVSVSYVKSEEKFTIYHIYVRDEDDSL